MPSLFQILLGIQPSEEEEAVIADNMARAEADATAYQADADYWNQQATAEDAISYRNMMDNDLNGWGGNDITENDADYDGYDDSTVNWFSDDGGWSE